MLRILIALFGLTVAAILFAPTALASNHRCSDYPSQAAAQAAYRADPVGKRSMDADGDGIACESNRAPYDRNPVQAGQPAQPTSPPAATATPRPAATPTPRPAQATPTPVRAARLPDGWALVTRVIDGDTVDVQLWDTGATERIRVVGIDTPEVHGTRECYGPEASATARDWLTGQWIWLEADLSQDERDRYGRLLRYLWLEDPVWGWWDFGYWMIADGHAYEYTYRTPYQYQADYRAAEAAAWSAGSGLWAAETCAGAR